MLLSEGFGWYTFQPPSSAVSTTLVGHYYSGVYKYRLGIGTPFVFVYVF